MVRTRLDDTAAAIAAGHFAEQFAKLKAGDNHDAASGSAPTGTTGEGDLGREMADGYVIHSLRHFFETFTVNAGTPQRAVGAAGAPRRQEHGSGVRPAG